MFLFESDSKHFQHARNSFFVQIDSGASSLWDLEIGPDWEWDAVSDRDGDDPVFFSLTAGVHTIRIKLREDGSQIDKLLLVNDPNFVPTGLGDPAPTPTPTAPIAVVAPSASAFLRLTTPV